MLHAIRTWRAGTLLLSLAALALPSSAHGSIFVPPKDDDNPGSTYRGPSDVNRGGRSGAGGDGSGPAAPPPGGNSTGTGTGSLPPVGGASGPATLAAADALALDSWLWWWEFNKEPFLALRRHLRSTEVTTGSDGFYLGRGMLRAGAGPGGDPALVRDRILPALVEALGGSPSADLTTGVLVALAKIGNDQDDALRRDLAPLLKARLADPRQEVSETAAVALGLLGDLDSASLLASLAADGEEGRRAVLARRVAPRTRVFAAYGLGVLGHRSENEDVRRFAVHKLAWVLAGDDSASPDLAVACVLALGRVPLAWAGAPIPSAGPSPARAGSRESQVALLLGIVRDERADAGVRAHATTSLGTVLALDASAGPPVLVEEVCAELVQRLGAGAGEPREVRQSAATALGLLGDLDPDPRDAAVRSALLGAARADRDGPTRHFAAIALARIAARPGRGEDPEAAAAIQTLFLRDLARSPAPTRPWMALALGIQERFRAASFRQPPDVDVAAALRSALAEAPDAMERGALCIANGILGDPTPEGELRSVMERGGEDWLRGLAAIALGLVDARGSLERLRALAADSTYHPELLRELAIALGLLGDSEASRQLVQSLQKASSLASQASLARALGRIGDQGAVDPLISLLCSSEEVDLARAFAAVALGEVADRDELPWNTIFSVDTNYLAAPPTLFDLQGFGLLNIL
ncbi:MAG: hypothetical protein AB1726_10035 [Planctomycetota bacterium]